MTHKFYTVCIASALLSHVYNATDCCIIYRHSSESHHIGLQQLQSVSPHTLKIDADAASLGTAAAAADLADEFVECK